MPEAQSKPPRYWVHRRTLAAGARFEPILQHYGLEFQRIDSKLTGHCPFHRSERPLLLIDLGRRIFHCFDCGASGNPLDFVARMEKVSVHRAAEIVAGICGIGLLPDENSNRLPTDRSETTKSA